MLGADSPLMRKRRKEDDEMDITPMIDITFLLLIFFLVASKMDEAAALNLPPARHGIPVGARNAVVISVKKGGGDADAKIYRGENLKAADLFKGDLVQQEEAITAYVDEQIETNTELHYVLIKAEEDVKHADVARVAKAVGKSENAQQLYVAVMENT